MNSAATRVERSCPSSVSTLGGKRAHGIRENLFTGRYRVAALFLPRKEQEQLLSLYRSDRISIESRPWKSLDRGIALYNFCSRISTPAIILPSIRFKLQAAHFFSKGNDSHPFRRDETNDLDREDSIIGQLR